MPNLSTRNAVFGIYKPRGVLSNTVVEYIKQYLLALHHNKTLPDIINIPKLEIPTEPGAIAPPNQTKQKEYFKKGRNPKLVKVGHGGTLDPMAEGILIIGINQCTKSLQYFLNDSTKRYIAKGQFGISTDTLDITGNITEKHEYKGIPEADIKDVLKKMIGEVEQIPPAYSAIRVNGKRAYALSRNGEIPELKPRTVYIKSLDLSSYDQENGTFELDIECGSGTYIRSIIRDIGDSFGVGAYMSSLTRTKQSIFSTSNITDTNPKVGVLSMEDCLDPVKFEKYLDENETTITEYLASIENKKRKADSEEEKVKKIKSQ